MCVHTGLCPCTRALCLCVRRLRAHVPPFICTLRECAYTCMLIGACMLVHVSMCFQVCVHVCVCTNWPVKQQCHSGVPRTLIPKGPHTRGPGKPAGGLTPTRSMAGAGCCSHVFPRTWPGSVSPRQGPPGPSFPEPGQVGKWALYVHLPTGERRGDCPGPGRSLSCSCRSCGCWLQTLHTALLGSSGDQGSHELSATLPVVSFLTTHRLQGGHGSCSPSAPGQGQSTRPQDQSMRAPHTNTLRKGSQVDLPLLREVTRLLVLRQSHPV